MSNEQSGSELPSQLEATFAAMKRRGFSATLVPDRPAALSTVLGMIPNGAAVAHGFSTTLVQIGFVDVMSRPGAGWRYLNDEWRKENDAARRTRTRAILSAGADVFLGGVQAICETGEVIGCDLVGSRQACYVYGPPRVIWVSGINKLVRSVEEGMRRAREVALPMEDLRIKAVGGAGSAVGKLVVYEKEFPGRIHLVLVNEALGY